MDKQTLEAVIRAARKAQVNYEDTMFPWVDVNLFIKALQEEIAE